MSWVKDQAKMPVDAFTHSDPLAEAVTGNQFSLNPDRNFRASLSAGYDDDRLAQSVGVRKDDYMHGGEAVAAIVGAIFGGEALAGLGAGGGAGAGAGAEAGAGATAVGGDAGAATAAGGAAEGGVGTVVGDAGAGDIAAGTGTSLVGDASAGTASSGAGDASSVAAGGGGDAGAVAGGGGDAGAATASGGTGAGTSSGLDLAGYAHKAATYLSLYNTATSLVKAHQAQKMGADAAPAAPPVLPQAAAAPDLTAIRKKNSLLFGDDSPASTDLTKGNASTGNLGKATLLGS